MINIFIKNLSLKTDFYLYFVISIEMYNINFVELAFS